MKKNKREVRDQKIELNLFIVIISKEDLKIKNNITYIAYIKTVMPVYNFFF